MNKVHYLDNSATTSLSEEVKEKIKDSLDIFGNPSSLHNLGFLSEKEIRTAREYIAKSLSVMPEEIYFTSGGTEANNIAIIGGAHAKKRRGNKVVISDSEHPSVNESASELEKEGFEVIRLKTAGGEINLDEAARVLDEKVIILSVMHTNNETGAVYPIEKLVKIARRQSPEALIHTDCVQAYMKAPVSAKKLGVDMISISAHKIHALKGTGALYVKNGVRVLPRSFGGEQEKKFRPGTENLLGIIAFGEAVKNGIENLEKTISHTNGLRSLLIEELEKNPLINFHIPPVHAPNMLNFSVKGIRSETLIHHLSSKDIYLSSGSACSSKKGTSGVLFSFGLGRDEADSSLRASLSRYNTKEDILALTEELMGIDKKLAGKK